MVARTVFPTIATNAEDNLDAPRWMLAYYELDVPIMFSLLSVGLALASCSAIRNKRLYFDERLQGEIHRIRTTLIVFTVAYMTRAVVYTVYHILIHHGKSGPLTSAIIYYVGWICWDVIPLTLIMSYQARKVKKIESKRATTPPDSLLLASHDSTASNLNRTRSLAFPEEDEVMFLGNPEYTELLLQN